VLLLYDDSFAFSIHLCSIWGIATEVIKYEWRVWLARLFVIFDKIVRNWAETVGFLKEAGSTIFSSNEREEII